jgi:endonuclease-3
VTRKERAEYAIRALRRAIPRPETELEYTDPYELIVAVILSAQCTDERVNQVTPGLFEAFPTVAALAEAEPGEVLPFVKSISYPNNKSRHLTAMARRVVREFGGQIPGTVTDLMKLEGVGRKTAQVVASVAFDEDALPVDTHIFRVANRIGLTYRAKTPLHVERQLKKLIPVSQWSEGHHLLILHGRYRCTARSPKCVDCPVARACLYFERLEKLPAPITGLNARKGKYYCKTRSHYFDEPHIRTDRHGVRQIACPICESMTVFLSRTGETTKAVPDYRV